MAGLISQADDTSGAGEDILAHARSSWEGSMLPLLGRLRSDIAGRTLPAIAAACGGQAVPGGILLAYWGQPTLIRSPDMEAVNPDSGQNLPTFDQAMLMYYLATADGTPWAGRWISYRELPDGLFYHQAFQGYSGNRLARALGDKPAAFDQAAQGLGGSRLPGLGDHAFQLIPLPRVHLAAILWPGDDEFAPRASVLFDASAPHYLPTDGLALIGGGLAGRLIKAAHVPSEDG
jgi:hypothetical protein